MPNLVSSAISPNLYGFSKTFFSLKGMISLHPQKIFLTPLPPLGGSKNGAESLGGVHLVLQYYSSNQQLAKLKFQKGQLRNSKRGVLGHHGGTPVGGLGPSQKNEHLKMNENSNSLKFHIVFRQLLLPIWAILFSLPNKVN